MIGGNYNLNLHMYDSSVSFTSIEFNCYHSNFNFIIMVLYTKM